MSRNLLCCKGCEHLTRFSKLQGENIVKCKFDHGIKADTNYRKKGLWAQYNNVCPFRKYMGKYDFGDNPLLFSFKEGK